MPTRQGSIRLFRLFGIDVYLHWAWFLAAAYFAEQAKGYSSPVWSVLECLTLFLIVLIHEFGHALACRSVGGQANQIVLWPLGGVAYVSPPQRPGAMLWSIAAGPLVNVLLLAPLGALLMYARDAILPDNVHLFILTVWQINLGLLIFNMLPVYPLDGGQILRSLLWFIFGRANSLMIASSIGFLGVAGVVALAFWVQSLWLGILATFIALNCWTGFQNARALSRLANGPRRYGFECPACHTAPPLGAFWLCGRCRKPFDTFATNSVCPHCGAQYNVTACLNCGSLRPMNEWASYSAPAPPRL